MADAALGPAVSALDGIRERWSKVAYVGLKPEVVPEPGYQAPWLPDVARLLKAVEAALKLADEAEPGLSDMPADCSGACWVNPCDCSGIKRPVAWTLDPAKLREAITAALTGTQRGEDGDHD